METSRESSNFSEKVAFLAPAQLQELEPRVARRRLSQARHRATLAGLFSSLRKTVYSQSDLTPSKVLGPECGEKVPHGQGLWVQVGTGPELSHTSRLWPG
ncbi:stimulated by retinoic acid gene 8 protein homolog [Manis pentadactyla]|uniref:stimulated by retinoic acid gene 8 protein homolog n=1 Tax=Manis pentadactyla TaxID=143292 RepID=UPI00255CF738|nr:stimulated by retinoic acid gene 8 protein homolog [Manis pentadactyla]